MSVLRLIAAGCVFVGLQASAQAQPKETELLFAGFGGTLQRAMQTQIMRPFERKYGVHITYITATSNESLAKVRAQGDHPQIDIIWATETTHDQGRALDLFVPLDPAQVPHLADLIPGLRTPGDVGAVMGMQGLVLEYNTKVFGEHGWAPPSSWFDLWDKRFSGHVASYNVPIGYATGFLGLINTLKGGSGTDLEPGWAAMKALMPSVFAFVDPPAQMDALFATGSAWIAYNGSGRVGDLANTGVPVAMVIPKEGALANPDFFDVVRHAPHPHLAQAFIDYVLSPEVQAEVARSMLLAPVNAKAVVPPEVTAKLGLDQKAVAGLRHVDMAALDAKLDALTQRWHELVASK